MTAVSRIRFTSARDVFDAFPSAAEDLRAAPTDDPPLVFAQALIQGPTPEDALSFCAYLLPRREAVWWSCQCVRGLMANLTFQEALALQAAEAWVREPQDEERRRALSLGMSGGRNAAATWVALAAGWSGGTIAAGDHAVPVAPHLTAKAVRIAVLTALARIRAQERTSQIRACFDTALHLACRPIAPGPR